MAKPEDELIKRLEETPIREYYLAFAQILRLIGELAKKMAEMQKNPTFSLASVSKPSAEFATILGRKTIKEISGEKLGPLLKAMFNIPPFTPSVLDSRQGTPQEKIEFGDKYIAIADEIERILE